MMGPSHSLHHIDVYRRQPSGHIITHWQESCPFKGSHRQMYWAVLEHFLWSALIVCVCVCIDDLRSRRGGWDAGGGRDTMIRSVPLTSLSADKAGHTLTHTHTAIPKHQRLITHLYVIFLWLCLWPWHHTHSVMALWGFNRAKPAHTHLIRFLLWLKVLLWKQTNKKKTIQDFYQKGDTIQWQEQQKILIMVLFKELTSLHLVTLLQNEYESISTSNLISKMGAGLSEYGKMMQWKRNMKLEELQGISWWPCPLVWALTNHIRSQTHALSSYLRVNVKIQLHVINIHNHFQDDWLKIFFFYCTQKRNCVLEP